MLILYAGLGMLRESVDGILHPSDMKVSALAVVIVAVTAVVKLFLGMYTIKVGKEVESDALLAVGEEGRNDSCFSLVTIVSSVIFIFTGLSLDAYAGVIFSIVVIKGGVESLKNTASDLIGRPGKEELAKQLYREVRKYIGKFVRMNDHVKSFHALYLSRDTDTIYCDFIVDYALKDWDGMRVSFEEYMKKQYPEYRIELTIETEFV